MNNLVCPHCGQPAISVMRKLVLGPAVPAKCQACGEKVGVPYPQAILALFPFLVAMSASAVVGPFPLKAALWVGAFLVMAVVYVRWVPLERR